VKLATLDDGTRDGQLLVVSQDGTRALAVPDIARTLQLAIDHWSEIEPRLREVAALLASSSQPDEIAVEPARLRAPLPRAYEWIDGSAYINHIVLVRKARGAEPPATLRTEPLVYQGGSGRFLGPTEDIAHFTDEWGIDFESEIAVITDDVPMGTLARDAGSHVRLLLLANDVTLRNLIPNELEKGFGFFVSKPSTAFSPFAVTPDELGGALREGRVHLPLRTKWNGKLFGDPNAGPEMHFSFLDLIEHATKTRDLTAGTIIGSGTVSNEDRARGASCIAEVRMREKIETGEIRTAFMKFGDTVEIEMLDAAGQSIFGAIRQKVARAGRSS
jgi:fumarylacetoacetate (FAA) hydrolase